MRAGANEFFTWPPAEETFHGAIRRTAARRETAQGARPTATTLVFFGAKGGAGHDDGRGELRRRAGAPQQAADGDRRPEAGPRRGGAVSRRPPALQPARRDRQPAPARSRVPQGAGGEAQVGARDSGRLRSVRSARRRPTAAPIEELFRLLARQYEYIVIDAGSQINSCSVAGALHRRHDLPRRQSGRAVGAQRAAAARARPPARRLRRARARAAQPRRRAVSRFRRSRSRPRSATRFITRSRATTRRCRRRSTRACRWR